MDVSGPVFYQSSITPTPSSFRPAGRETPAGFTPPDWFLSLGLVAATLLAYLPAWHGQPIWDDAAHLTRPALRSLEGLRRIWAEPGATQQYYPVVHSAFWFQHRLWGDTTTGYHLVSLLLHAFSALLVLRILRRLEVPGAAWAAALFALHPVQVESVAWISELKNTLSGACYLGAALAYLRFDGNRQRKCYALSLGLFLLGLMAKTVIATLPAALLVVFWWQRGGLSWRRDVRPLLPFFAIGLVSGIYTAWVENKFVGADPHDFPYSLLERGLIAGRVFWFYLGKLGWPARLIFNYPRWQISAAVAWQYLYPLAALLLLAGAWAWRKRDRGPLAGLLFFTGTLFPALGFVNVYPFRYAFVADHFQYLASLGAFTLAAAGAARLAERGRWPSPQADRAAGLLLLAALAGLTWRQSTMYADSESLYQQTLADNPDSWLAHNNIGIARFEQGRLDEAVAHWRTAIAIQPGNVESYRNLGVVALAKGRIDEAIAYYQKALQLNPLYAGAHYNLGNALFKKGRLQEAVIHWQKALAIQPDYADAYCALGVAFFQQGQLDPAIEFYHQALAFAPDNAEAHYNLGNALLQKGAVNEAVAEWQKALAIEPGNAMAHKNLGMVAAQQGRMDEAIAHWQKTVALQPDDADTHRNLGVALFKKGQAEEAIVHWQKALDLDPKQVRTRINLAWVLATWPVASVRNGARALELARQADQLSGGDNPLVLRTLAAAYAETGQFPEAEATAQKALALALAQNNSEMAAALQTQLKLHQAGSPCREPPGRP